MKNVFMSAVITCLGICTCIQTAKAQNDGVEINGVMWATCNVDAPGTFTANPEDEGMLYKWGSNIGWSDDGPPANTNGSNTWRHTTHNDDEWEIDYDPCPNGWRVPTLDEIQSLFDESVVSKAWTTLNNTYGIRFTDINNGNSIFLPAANARDANDGSFGNGDFGCYWSCTPNSSDYAYYLYFDSGNTVWGNNDGDRGSGFSIRPVAE